MVPLATPASFAMSCMVAAAIPLRAMTRMAASWMEAMRYSWTTSSLDLAGMVRSLNERSVNQNSGSADCGVCVTNAVISCQLSAVSRCLPTDNLQPTTDNSSQPKLPQMMIDMPPPQRPPRLSRERAEDGVGGPGAAAGGESLEAGD